MWFHFSTVRPTSPRVRAVGGTDGTPERHGTDGVAELHDHGELHDHC